MRREGSAGYFSQPYSFREAAAWIFNNAFGPSSRYNRLTRFIPQTCNLNSIETKLRLGFLGDIMPCRASKLLVDPAISNFFSETDYLVGNFEGTLLAEPTRSVFLGQVHTGEILDRLAEIYPPAKTILCFANNHSCDFGSRRFRYSLDWLRDYAFQTFGERERPAITLGKVNLACGTQWSNRPCDYIARLDEADSYHNDNSEFNILYPHWGYELCLYPNPLQISLGARLLQRWDMVVGHHAHSPQPVAAYETDGGKKLLAYSLGDFTFRYNIQKYRNGIILTVCIGPGADGRWRVGEVRWAFTQLTFEGRGVARLDKIGLCSYFCGKL